MTDPERLILVGFVVLLLGIIIWQQREMMMMRREQTIEALRRLKETYKEWGPS